MDRDAKRRLVEALILASPEPISSTRLAELVPHGKPGLVTDLVGELNEFYEQHERGFEIWEVAGGFQLRTRTDLASYVQQMHELRPARLSRAALETLAIVAYRQPVTRAEIEHVRGVDCSGALRRLLELRLVKILGKDKGPGRPIIYGTSREFLSLFNLADLRDLPTLEDFDLRPQELPPAAQGGEPG